MTNHRIVWDTYPAKPLPEQRSKLEILIERREFLREETNRLVRQIEGLFGTYCDLNCSGCGEFLATEADFAAHFRIKDENYLNLGSCPNV